MIVAVLILSACLLYFMVRTITLEERVKALVAELIEARRNQHLWPPQ